MKVTKIIEKEIKSCSECPYYYENQDMSATLHCCSLKGKGYDSVLDDISNYNTFNTISNFCPYKNSD
jgi:hypothetical protein